MARLSVWTQFAVGLAFIAELLTRWAGGRETSDDSVTLHDDGSDKRCGSKQARINQRPLGGLPVRQRWSFGPAQRLFAGGGVARC